ncbi:hypothetical protein [Flavobacterium johnsoniae]|jgi:hypothetical protein|uniref:Uncharacterized protein n=2 Tax=Flavobacterium johnsoniae TaxID=986 RepID=A0A1M5J1T2_FLAJO|nr:hypothetical protein [Flavobacterium johnsoniae]WQG80366.1 hypothetical protein SR927_20375 [Flavobacterium johnsoniae UW101]SHG34547.1 hypothetical protein SAMN05444388_102351 [Flavobacterium johnsoniae]SHL01845.1 hypothetical protein SAMN05444146_2679 [Flavobacterium johnsoniae]
MQTSQKQKQQFQQQLFEYFSQKDNSVTILENEMVITKGTDKGLTFTYLSDHSCIIHCYEFSLNTDLDIDTTIDTFIKLLVNHNLIHQQSDSIFN